MRKLWWIIALLSITGLSGAQQLCVPLLAPTLNDILEDCSLLVGSGCTPDESDINLQETVLTSPAVFALAGNGETDLVGWLVGSAQVNNITVSEIQIRMEARNRAGYNINLRSGPGTTYAQSGILRFDEIAYADARSDNGTWVRLITDTEGFAWVNASLIELNGDTLSLPVATGNETTANQNVTLTASACSDIPSGVLFIYEGLTPTSVTVNEISLQMTGAVVFVTADAANLYVSVIEGRVGLSPVNEPLTLETGQSAIITPASVTVGALHLALPARLPLTDLLDIPVMCIAQTSTDTAIRALPTEDADTVLLLETGRYGLVEGQNSDSGWLSLAVDAVTGWVKREMILLIGDCENMPQIDDSAPQVPLVSNSASDPAIVMVSYLQARVEGNVNQMQALSCSSWDNQAIIQAQSFRSMNASLENVACHTVSSDSSQATVACEGHILTEYNGQTRTWELGSYRFVVESGSWQMCGES
jgi:hypothetical protein